MAQLIFAVLMSALLLAPVAEAQDTASVMSAAAEHAVKQFGRPMPIQLDPRVFRGAGEHKPSHLLAARRVTKAEVRDSAYMSRCRRASDDGCWAPGPNGRISLSAPVIVGDTALVVVGLRFYNPSATGSRYSIREDGSEQEVLLAKSGSAWKVVGHKVLRAH